MKKMTQRKINEYNPAEDGARAARQDDLARRDKNRPYSYYASQFYDLEEIRQQLIDLGFKYRSKEEGGQFFKKAAILVEKAQNEMLKAGR